MKEINLVILNSIKEEKIIVELGDLAQEVGMSDENNLMEGYLYLNRIKKDLDIVTKLYDNKIRELTKEKMVDNDKFTLEFKSSKLFDKEKAASYIFEKKLQNDFMVQDLDYKKVQSYIKSMANYDDFVKLGSKKITIKRKISKNLTTDEKEELEHSKTPWEDNEQ